MTTTVTVKTPVIQTVKLQSQVNVTAGGSDPTKLPLAGGTMTGEIVLDEIRETVYTALTVDINPANGSVQVRTLAGNETLTFSNIAAGQAVLLKVVPGAFTLTLTNIAKWTGGGAAPSAIAAEHWIVVANVDGTIVGTDVGGVS